MNGIPGSAPEPANGSEKATVRRILRRDPGDRCDVRFGYLCRCRRVRQLCGATSKAFLWCPTSGDEVEAQLHARHPHAGSTSCGRFSFRLTSLLAGSTLV